MPRLASPSTSSGPARTARTSVSQRATYSNSSTMAGPTSGNWPRCTSGEKQDDELDLDRIRSRGGQCWYRGGALAIESPGPCCLRQVHQLSRRTAAGTVGCVAAGGGGGEGGG